MKKKLLLLVTIGLTAIFIISCSPKNRIPIFDGEEIVLSDSEYLDSNLKELVSIEELDNKIKNQDSFVIYIYNDLCEASNAFKLVLDNFVHESSIVINCLKRTKIDNKHWIRKEIKFVPAVVIFKQGSIIAKLLPDDGDQIDCFKNVEGFSNWFYIYVKQDPLE